MIYPYMTMNDGTEYTHSEMKSDGTVLVYAETPDEKDGFHSLVCILPQYEVRNVIGYTETEQKEIIMRIEKNAHLIMEFSQIGGFASDATVA
ncbi:MAG: hypothetical protein Q4D21_10305 [Phascolarctobacterium sp.]|nr:hypothetical protein [Phascolarctobacterium sp.]